MSEKATTERDKVEALRRAGDKGNLAKAYEKINRKEYPIEVPRSMNLIETLKKTIKLLKGSEKAKEISEQIQKAEQQLNKAENDLIKATLVPLSAMDLLLVQSYVAEASIKGEEASFDPDVRLFMLVKSEQCATVWLSLRSTEDKHQRYFIKQEDIVLLDELTLRTIVVKYKEAFVLEDEERKNL